MRAWVPLLFALLGFAWGQVGVELRADTLYRGAALEVEVPYAPQLSWSVGAALDPLRGTAGGRYGLATRYYAAGDWLGPYSGTRFYVTEYGSWFGLFVGVRERLWDRPEWLSLRFELGAVARLSGEDPAWLRFLLGAAVGVGPF